MKKLITFSIMLMLALHVSAQKFQFTYKGEALADGSTLVINAETDMFGELACETNPAANPAEGLLIVGKNGAYISGTAHLTILEHTFKAKQIQWCMGGACVLMKDITELDKSFEGTEVQVLFDAFTIRQEGYLLAKLDVTVGGESQTLYIEFSNGQHSNISSLAANEGSAVVFDLNGRTVMTNSSASDSQMLRPGVYVVKSGNKTRKVVVK
ncbi:MAG: T9SS type A sorting domain-containing protein [Prevotella sp.]|nr:T9SS type A sorting domain-containing protein [Prevotella sp.]